MRIASPVSSSCARSSHYSDMPRGSENIIDEIMEERKSRRKNEFIAMVSN